MDPVRIPVFKDRDHYAPKKLGAHDDVLDAIASRHSEESDFIDSVRIPVFKDRDHYAPKKLGAHDDAKFIIGKE